MNDHLVHTEQAVSQPAPSVSPDLGVGLIFAVIAAVIIIRYLKVILFLVAFVGLAVVLAGLVQIEPVVEAMLQHLRSATGR